MKVENKSTLYFSAYRLKTLEAAIEESNGGEQASPYLRSLLNNKAKTMSRIRISTMVNPYQDTVVKNESTRELK